MIARPVGDIFVQFPGQKTPAELFGGTWEDVSARFAGGFFRAEGGLAQPFDGQEAAQADEIKGHSHTMAHTHTRGSMEIAGYSGTTLGNWSGAFSGQNQGTGIGQDFPIVAYQLYFQASRNWTGSTSQPSAASTGDTGGEETRPVNWTVRLWERTA